MKKTIILIVVLVVVGALFFIYVLRQLTPGDNSIKDYRYNGSVDNLIMNIQSYAKAKPGISFKITDTTGNAESGFAYYMDIELKDNKSDFLFTIKCKDGKKHDSSAAQTDAKLIFAFDRVHIIGGYNKDAQGIEPLVKAFDVRFLVPLENDQHLSITPIR